MQRVGSHAVVIGASMGGLLAARALSGAYERVTVLDRDALPAGPDSRRGVPQGRHLHVLLSRGAEVMESMFPGLLDEIEGAGVPVGRDWETAWIDLGGHLFALPEKVSGTPIYQLSRPFLESRVRGRVAALPDVELIPHAEATTLLATPDRTRVTGVRVRRDGTESDLAADLVVDATGRTGRAPVWLGELGYPLAREEQLEVGLMYATRRLRLPAAAIAPLRFVGIGPNPALPRALGLEELEDGTWIMTAVGYAGDHPPTDEAGFDAFCASVAPPHILAAIRAAEPQGPVVTHRYPASLRRRYEKLDRFPAGFLVFGDAICSFNPLYAQGMTVASLQARALRRCLAAGGDPATDGFAHRFFRAAARPVAAAWLMAIGEDLALPQVTARRNPKMRGYVFYVNRLKSAAERDPVVAERFLRVVRFLDGPMRLGYPDVALRVLAARRLPVPQRGPDPASGSAQHSTEGSRWDPVPTP